MAADRILKARVEAAFARKVDAWAQAHGTDVSGAIREGLRMLVEEEDRKKRLEAAMEKFRRAEKAGFFDPPTGVWKAGGFK